MSGIPFLGAFTAKHAGLMLAIEPLGNDQSLTALAVGNLDDLPPTKTCPQQYEAIEINVDFRETFADIFVDLEQPLTDVDAVQTTVFGMFLRVHKTIHREERRQGRGLEPPAGRSDKSHRVASRTTERPRYWRQSQPSSHCSKAIAGNAGEARDHLGAYLNAQHPLGERSRAKLAVDNRQLRVRFHGGYQHTDQYAVRAAVSRAISPQIEPIYGLTARALGFIMPLFCSASATAHA